MYQRQFFLNCFICIVEEAGETKVTLRLQVSLWTWGSSSWAFAPEFSGAGGQAACPWLPRQSAALASHSQPRVFPINNCISHHHMTLNLYEKLGGTLDFSSCTIRWNTDLEVNLSDAGKWATGESLGPGPKTLGFPARSAEQMRGGQLGFLHHWAPRCIHSAAVLKHLKQDFQFKTLIVATKLQSPIDMVRYPPLGWWRHLHPHPLTLFCSKTTRPPIVHCKFFSALALLTLGPITSCGTVRPCRMFSSISGFC